MTSWDLCLLVTTESPPIGPANSFMLETRCPSRFPPVHALLLGSVGAVLVVLGVVDLLVLGGDVKIIWGLDGLDIGVVDFLM